MSRKELSRKKTVSYGDVPAHLFLWQKSFLLVPIWAIPIIPVAGFLFRSMGSVGLQVGFGLVLSALAIYFLEDMLKRKITMDDEYIFFGFKAIPIATINSIDVTYKKGKFLPRALMLGCESGKKMKFNLNGLSEDSVEIFLKHLHSKNSTLKAAAVLNTLVKCRNVRRKPPDSTEILELPYETRQFIGQTTDVFLTSARKWARLGPVVVCLLVGPLMWIGMLNSLYLCLQPQASSLNLHAFLSRCLETFVWSIQKLLGSAGEALQQNPVSPVVVCITVASILAFVFYLIRLILKPNCLTVDTKGIRLARRIGEIVVPEKSVSWAQIEKIDLTNENRKGGKIRIQKFDGQKLDLALAAIAPEDRPILLRRIEKLVPNSQIDHELSRAMLPGSDRSYTEIWLRSLNQSPERKTLEPLEPGQLVGDSRFEVLRSIGVGGQGKAYLCRPLEVAGNVSSSRSEVVVLKETIIPVFADTSVRRKALESFEREARLLMELKDESIVKLLDYFVEDHRAYLVLEHIDGCNLREYVLREGPLSEAQVHELALQMSEMLKYLHSNSIVHRDFTPDNLILNSKGRLKLIDFNVAQNIRNGFSGTIVGKHAYLPPEQFRGQATAQSDLYAMGATLFFLLTGTDPEPISQSSPAAKNSEVSEVMNKIVKRATALQQNNRYQSATDIEMELLAAQEAAHECSTELSLQRRL